MSKGRFFLLWALYWRFEGRVVWNFTVDTIFHLDVNNLCFLEEKGSVLPIVYVNIPCVLFLAHSLYANFRFL